MLRGIDWGRGARVKSVNFGRESGIPFCRWLCRCPLLENLGGSECARLH
jgi:hypothetical protein